MKFTSALAIVLATLPFMMASADDASAAACTQVCCDVVVPSIRPGGNAGINCHQDATGDCFFGGQVNSCCARIVPNGARVGTGVGCA